MLLLKSDPGTIANGATLLLLGAVTSYASIVSIMTLLRFTESDIGGRPPQSIEDRAVALRDVVDAGDYCPFIAASK